MHELELGEAALASTRDQPGGVLRITAPVDLGHTLLPLITRAYLDAWPATRVEMLLSNRVVDLVGEGIDLAIRVGPLKDSSMIARRFFDLTMHLWASPAYLAQAGAPRHPRELARHRFVGHTDLGPMRLSKGKTQHEAVVDARVTADDLEAIKVLLLLGEGIGLLPDFLAADAAAAGTLVPVLGEWQRDMEGGFYFLYPGRKYASPKVQAFIDTALRVLGEQAAAR